MSGYGSNTTPSQLPMPRWQSLIVEAVGDVIDFWGFKRNHGRVWALLYLNGRALSSTQLRESLELSKGAVSMITRELEEWDVIEKLGDDAGPYRFAARTDFTEMITRVLREREGALVQRVLTDLEDAWRLAKLDDDVDDATIERIERMRRLAGLMKQALNIFMKTARLDVSDSDVL